ncbi:hypothetical protein [Mesorhizobium sp.]|uniref:hypothetical protein n=1 Tax=Mesorhizobium sp. TaxID=1871066 RepID=UPI000FE94E01|nr:hypothetical protein [Mesorhizobium sp.]RWP26762.1 MAG: hypothetical protein EOR03_31965 [Mesorhizobium sp.]
MSTFNVTKTNTTGTPPEVEGTAFAATKFVTLYAEYETGELDGAELFSKWIDSLLRTPGVTVTYGDLGHPVSLSNDKIVTTINGKVIRLRLKSDDDDFKRRKITMITPSSQPSVNAQYLIDAVSRIKNEVNATKAQAFLLGSILLKRCR